MMMLNITLIVVGFLSLGLSFAIYFRKRYNLING